MALVMNPENSGFGAGVNLGIRAAAAIERPQYVLLLNNDATVAPDFLPPLLEELSDPAVAAATGLIYRGCGTDRHPKLWYAGGRLDPIRALGVHRTKPLTNGACDVEFVTGCFVALKLDILERYGLLPERYFLYSEDVELSFILRRAGYRLRITPRSVAYHKVNAAAKHWRESPLVAYLHHRNRLWFARRNLPPSARLLSFAWLIPSRLGRAALEILWGRPKIAGEVLRGTLHGLLTPPR
jgi:GT2 family glycosyltransferase